ncbi:MAG: hypothetical protein OEM67_09645 [Thermoleophilia bacterium]|nr:hypothetical protein [Thermoleophilia bacterium]MDH3725313.1 hypothetical protein [Thermoleophilia bacterium]
MPGSRPIHGCDVYAALRRFAVDEVDLAAARKLLDPGEQFNSFEELVQACPPEQIGLRFGRFAALAAPLFGEFE